MHYVQAVEKRNNLLRMVSALKLNIKSLMSNSEGPTIPFNSFTSCFAFLLKTGTNELKAFVENAVFKILRLVIHMCPKKWLFKIN